jgi:RNA polymerase sigma factor (sigma-70 family)
MVVAQELSIRFMTRPPQDSPDPSDEEPTARLVEQIQGNVDRERNLERLYQRYRLRVRRFFTRKGFSAEQADDLTQETFFRVLKNIGRLEDVSSFPGWLFEIAANVYRNELRSWGTEKRHGIHTSVEDFNLDIEGRPFGSRHAFTSPDPDPLEQTIERQQHEALDLALEELPSQMRRCILLRVRSGLRYREIAAIMQISVETVKAHLHKAQERLKMALGAVAGDEE